jgi:spore coat polysaccharide biosynthesis protein SpsF (cytidylyltransferase family)
MVVYDDGVISFIDTQLKIDLTNEYKESKTINAIIGDKVKVISAENLLSEMQQYVEKYDFTAATLNSSRSSQK